VAPDALADPALRNAQVLREQRARSGLQSEPRRIVQRTPSVRAPEHIVRENQTRHRAGRDAPRVETRRDPNPSAAREQRPDEWYAIRGVVILIAPTIGDLADPELPPRELL